MTNREAKRQARSALAAHSRTQRFLFVKRVRTHGMSVAESKSFVPMRRMPRNFIAESGRCRHCGYAIDFKNRRCCNGRGRDGDGTPIEVRHWSRRMRAERRRLVRKRCT